MVIEETSDERSRMTSEQLYKIEIYSVLGTSLFQINWHCKQIKTISDNFCFLNASNLQSISATALCKSAANQYLRQI